MCIRDRAKAGRRVLLLEKDRHPRFHIGESLLPMNLPILARLGVLDRIAAIGVRKIGADFPLPADRPGDTHVFRFDRSLTPGCTHAFQVRRDRFDAELFDAAREAGADGRLAGSGGHRRHHPCQRGSGGTRGGPGPLVELHRHRGDQPPQCLSLIHI